VGLCAREKGPGGKKRRPQKESSNNPLPANARMGNEWKKSARGGGPKNPNTFSLDGDLRNRISTFWGLRGAD